MVLAWLFKISKEPRNVIRAKLKSMGVNYEENVISEKVKNWKWYGNLSINYRENKKNNLKKYHSNIQMQRRNKSNRQNIYRKVGSVRDMISI